MTQTITYTPDPAMAYWPTPDDVADDLVYPAITPGYGFGEAAGGVPQVRILEPSAGEGHLARIARGYLPHAHITAVEPSPARVTSLRASSVADEVIESTLEDYIVTVAMQAMADEWTPYELVFMNPPFTLPGRREAWAEHILAIYNDPNLVAPGGTLGAIVPLAVLRGTSPRVRAVRDLIGPPCGRYADGSLLGERGRIEPCDRRAFAASGTGWATALMWTQKPFTPEVN